jgi:hypothetical protein
MANPRKVWGQTIIRMNGRELATEGKSTMEVGGTKREPAPSDHHVGYFTESTEPGKFEFSVLVTRDVSAVALQKLDDVHVTFEADTGQTYSMDHGYVADVISVSEGKAKVVVMGEVQEVAV